MKKSISICFAFAFAVIFAGCSKSTAVNATLAGKWNLLTDSLLSGVGPVSTPKYYSGQPGDYFDFRTDNKLYIKEGSTLDTLAYSLGAGNTITIQTFGISFNGVLQSSNYTVNVKSAIITTPFVVNPGAYYRRVVHLAR